jgi:hypothetical protein
MKIALSRYNGNWVHSHSNFTQLISTLTHSIIIFKIQAITTWDSSIHLLMLVSTGNHNLRFINTLVDACEYRQSQPEIHQHICWCLWVQAITTWLRFINTFVDACHSHDNPIQLQHYVELYKKCPTFNGCGRTSGNQTKPQNELRS